MKGKLTLLLLIVACLGCSRYPSHLSQTEQIQAVILNDLATQLFGADHVGNDAYPIFLSVGDPQVDPSKEVLAYSAASFRNTRPYSVATPANPPGQPSTFSYGVLEKGTSRQGAIFWVDAFVLTGDGPLKIRARRFYDGLNGELFEYRVQRIKEKWRVLGRETLSIS